MTSLQKPYGICCCLPILIALAACGAPKAECDTPENRAEVLKLITDDHANALGRFAADHPNPAKDEKSKETPASREPLYTLGDQMITRSVSGDKKTLQCSGAISATVNGTKATKEFNYTVQQSSDGKSAVSVAPFQFD
jgi:hypothetical protein